MVVYGGNNLEARVAMAIASIMVLSAMYVGNGGATHMIGKLLVEL
ncbi:MAG: hypothetical protein M1308_07015 [Actinobacteria bacterium]|nr:hypothetical protein [Actinomycetota bacterium]